MRGLKGARLESLIRSLIPPLITRPGPSIDAFENSSYDFSILTGMPNV